jgi:diacylglycerol kinase (ATP)
MKPTASTEPAPSPFKSKSGVARIWSAFAYSRDGLCAAFRHEAAFRQELAVGLPLIAVACWWSPGRWQTLAMVLSIVFVLVMELVNSAIEALADATTEQPHPLIKRAKDMGSAAVMLSIGMAVLVWAVALS